MFTRILYRGFDPRCHQRLPSFACTKQTPPRVRRAKRSLAGVRCAKKLVAANGTSWKFCGNARLREVLWVAAGPPASSHQLPVFSVFFFNVMIFKSIQKAYVGGYR